MYSVRSIHPSSYGVTSSHSILRCLPGSPQAHSRGKARQPKDKSIPSKRWGSRSGPRGSRLVPKTVLLGGKGSLDACNWEQFNHLNPCLPPRMHRVCNHPNIDENRTTNLCSFQTEYFLALTLYPPAGKFRGVELRRETWDGVAIAILLLVETSV